MRFRKGKKRWAAAAVEMAVVTPMLLTMLFGIIEYGWVFTVRQGLTTAAREGARVAALPGSTDTDIQNRVASFLTPLGVTTYNLTITHATVTDASETVRLTVPYADVTLVGSFFGSTSYDLGATCSMRKEGID